MTGSYSAVLTIENGAGEQSTLGPVVIDMNPAPPLLLKILTVPIDSGTITTTLAVTTFEAQDHPASGPIDLYEIDFGDGSPIKSGVFSPRFSHAFATNGVYNVMMRARGPLDPLDWSDWVTRSFTVVDPIAPSVVIAASVPSTALIGTLTLTGQALPGSGPIDAWRWVVTRAGVIVGNYTGQIVEHNFATAGVYTITVTAEGPVADAQDSRPITITVPPPPTIVSLVANPSPATTGLEVSFTPVVTGSVSTWEWDYTGAGYVAGAQVGAHIFNSPGSFEVKLRITGPFGGQDERSVTVVVNPSPAPSVPVASSPNPVLTGTTVALTSSDASGLTGLTWNWVISNDNGPETIPFLNAGPSISHIFALAGSWTVTVTATDALGVVGTAFSFVTVVDPPPPPPVANFIWSPGVGPLEIQFTDTSTGPAADIWLWNFDGPVAVGDTAAQHPLVTYSAPGTYFVTLTVTSGGVTSSTPPIEVIVS